MSRIFMEEASLAEEAGLSGRNQNKRQANQSVLSTPTTRFAAQVGASGSLDPNDDRTFIPRLTARLSEPPFNPEMLVRAVNLSHHMIFCDTSIFDFDIPREVWAELLRSEQLVLIPAVISELEPWMAKNASHPMSEPVLSRDPRVQFPESLDVPETVRGGAHFYLNLLVRRKQASLVVEHQLTERLKRPPTREELIGEVQRQYGERGWLLAKKSTSGDMSSSSHADEELVCWSFAQALHSGVPTALLTRDKDVLEQYYKLWNLLDLDYRNLLLADSYVTDFASYRPQPFVLDEPALRDVFEDSPDNVWFERSPDLEDTVLPDESRFVVVSCWRAGKNLSQLSVCLDGQMKRLLEVKGATGGLNSDRLGERNCHLTLWPLQVPRRLQSIAVIARERRVRLDDSMTVGLLDFVRALATNEPVQPV